MDITSAGAIEIAELIRKKELSAAEAAEGFLARIDEVEPKVRAYINVSADIARRRAAAVDARLAAGEEAGRFAGVPLAIKDVLSTRGFATTCGSRMLEDFVPVYDATVVERVFDAGTVMLGKANMDEFAMGSSTENSYFGPTHNPWDLQRVPGGSSGGSAAAVAAGEAPWALGSDTGGSIRQPAALCGIVGMKPTYGLVSRYGLVAFASSLDQAGAFARTAEDCALLLNAMAGHDPRDSTSLDRPVEDYTRLVAAGLPGADAAQPLKGLRIGLPTAYFGSGNDPEVAAALEAALAELRRLGATTVDVELPNVGLAVPVYYVIAPAEASSNLSRFDGVRYGHRAAKYADLADMYKKSRAEGFGAEVKRRILVGTYVLSHGYYDAYYLKAQQVRRLIADDFRRAWDRCDVIAGPTAPTAAFPIGAKSDDPVQMYLNDIYTVAANLTGAPAMSIPCGFTADGRPLGLQLQGDYFAEAKLVAIAHRYQQATDWHRRAPAGLEGGRP
jgi:aspartyl-tRNA(Asn)/glutamyl-tRNA(Gln) amidotransferase subunit A